MPNGSGTDPRCVYLFILTGHNPCSDDTNADRGRAGGSGETGSRTMVSCRYTIGLCVIL